MGLILVLIMLFAMSLAGVHVATIVWVAAIIGGILIS